MTKPCSVFATAIPSKAADSKQTRGCASARHSTPSSRAAGASSAALSLRETAFWRNSEKFGVTSRIDIERVFSDVWLLRWTGSATISQRTEGVKGYTSLMALRGLSERRALGAELFTEGEFDADVPLGDYGLKLAYRQAVVRDWLVLETRVSLTFPRDEVWQVREATWGVGVGLEMFFGTNDFLARPVTF